jgi:hypothetical protein
VGSGGRRVVSGVAADFDFQRNDATMLCPSEAIMKHPQADAKNRIGSEPDTDSSRRRA